MPDATADYQVHFPEWYDERLECETPWKGYLQGVVVQMCDGTRYSLYFTDPIRLAQDLEVYVKMGKPYFTEPGLVVLPEVTTDAVRNAVADLFREGLFCELKPLS